VSDFDVIVVGAGNAALAAVSAREQGAGERRFDPTVRDGPRA
jgi:succinate dehydrogenase/fumarate reductase flavoprotein subunit